MEKYDVARLILRLISKAQSSRSQKHFSVWKTYLLSQWKIKNSGLFLQLPVSLQLFQIMKKKKNTFFKKLSCGSTYFLFPGCVVLETCGKMELPSALVTVKSRNSLPTHKSYTAHANNMPCWGKQNTAKITNNNMDCGFCHCLSLLDPSLWGKPLVTL